jgi:phage protein U
MHRDFVRQSALDRLREEQRQDFALVFERMDQQSRQLNQLVGAIKGKKNV